MSVRTTTIREFDGFLSFLWTEIGEGQLEKVVQCHSNGDVWACHRKERPGTFNTHWYCCCPDTKLYIGTDAEIAELERELKAKLAARRQEWEKEIDRLWNPTAQ